MNLRTFLVVLTGSILLVSLLFLGFFGVRYLWVFTSPSGRAFLQAYQQLHDNYLERPSSKVLLDGALQGMVKATEDEGLFWFPSEANSSFNNMMHQGGNGSIGVSNQAGNADLKTGDRLIEILPNSPAERAGLHPGDVVVAIDGVDVQQLPVDQIAQRLRGVPGSRVHVKLERDSKLLEFRVQREFVKVHAATATVLQGQIGLLRLSTCFTDQTAAQARVALDSLIAHRVKGIVLDLRDNAGGQIEACLQVADFFLDQGSLFVSKDRSGHLEQRKMASPAVSDYRGPLVVLINRFTASAAEMLAAALQGTGRARLIGVRSHGKGVANAEVSLADGSILLLPVVQWLTPKGENINKQGLQPDLVVPDDRLPEPLALSGTGAPSGAEITVQIAGQTHHARADVEGQFSLNAKLKQGNTDAPLKRALELLTVGQ